MSQATTDPKKKDATLNSLESVDAFIRGKYGDHSVRAAEDIISNVEGISTGIAEVDEVTGIGGLPIGMSVEIAGMPSTGKTTIALRHGANVNRKGKAVIHFDIEECATADFSCDMHGLSRDPNLYKIISSDATDPSKPRIYLEDVFEISLAYLRTGKVGSIIVDSVAALIPRNEAAGIQKNNNIGHSIVGVKAKALSQCIRNINPELHKAGVTMVFLNHIIAKVSDTGFQMGEPTTTPGGDALKFYAAMRLELRSRGFVMEGSGENRKKVGREVDVEAIKNKCAKPFGKSTFTHRFGEGIDSLGTLIGLGLNNGLIEHGERQAHWIKGQEEHKKYGMKRFREYLQDNPQIITWLEQKLGFETRLVKTEEAKPQETQNSEQDALTRLSQ